ncbi:MAG: porin family protein [Bdellovibrionales bacterium]|nr:porin family protein [Bdellovibrionales bacterium]
MRNKNMNLFSPSRTVIILAIAMCATNQVHGQNYISDSEIRNDSQMNLKNDPGSLRRQNQNIDMNQNINQRENINSISQRNNAPIIAQPTVTIIKQPATYVEAAPLAESRAEQLRKKRQEIEVQTEQQIVEKLESSRLEDERTRTERLFGNGKNSGGEKMVPNIEPTTPPTVPATPQVQQPPQPPATPVQATPIILYAPTQQAVEPSDKLDKKLTPEDLNGAKEEIINAIKDDKNHSSDNNKSSSVKNKNEADENSGINASPGISKKYSFGVALGTTTYPDGDNVESKGSVGLLLDIKTDSKFIFETGLIYTNLDIDDIYWVSGAPLYRNLDQYHVIGALKYSFLAQSEGNFKPYLGLGANYTYRKYTNLNKDYGYGYSYYSSENIDSTATSHAIDIIGLVGTDFMVNDTFSIGAEFRYSKNLIHRTNSDSLAQKYRPKDLKLIEESSYATFLINARYHF